MQYKQELPVDPNTTEENATEYRVKLTSGTITEILIHFPWGCANLVHCQVLRNTWQILPLTRGEYLGGNDFTHKYLTKLDILEEPYEIIVKLYNDDDTYLHTPFIVISMTRNVLSQKLQQLLEMLT
jgi:hypothetical protein